MGVEEPFKYIAEEFLKRFGFTVVDLMLSNIFIFFVVDMRRVDKVLKILIETSLCDWTKLQKCDM